MGYSFTFHFTDDEIDFNAKSNRFFNYHKFLLNEFFNSTDEELYLIMDSYRIHFGESAFRYVLKNYLWGWRHGDRTMTNVQEDRILYIMPKHLNESAIFRLNKMNIRYYT